MAALWLMLAFGYVVASITGSRVITMAVVSVMIGVLLIASGRFLAGGIASTLLIGLCLWFSASIHFIVYLPPLAAFAFMSFFFFRTLRPGSEALITRVARREHPDLPADMARHTRNLTVIWSLCFALLFVVALFLAPMLAVDTWSRWVQGLGYVVPGILFFGEYVYRHVRFRERKHSSIVALIRNIVIVSKEVAVSSNKHDPVAGR